jgi:pilus assembly protein Flp/PilA
MCRRTASCVWGRIRTFVTSEDGPTATEYAVMLALIIVTALTAIGTLGSNLWAWYTDIETALFT